MKKINYIIAIIAMLFNYTYSQQNLVPNPSFESYTACPNNIGQVNYATGWSLSANTPDYFNLCGTSGFSYPLNAFGYQYPSNGNAYCGLANYFSPTLIYYNYKEQIGHILSHTLTIGTKYYVSFKAVLSINSSVPSNCASSKLGAMFSKTLFTTAHPPPITNNPQIYSHSIITDTLNWTKIFGSFIADSAYQYITIGNFFDNINVDTLILTNDTYCSSYYFIDDICVATDSMYVDNYITGTSEIDSKNFSEFKIYPNPFDEFVTIINEKEEEYNFEIYSSDGNKHLMAKSSERLIKLEVKELDKGFYYLKIVNKDGPLIYKLIKK